VFRSTKNVVITIVVVVVEVVEVVDLKTGLDDFVSLESGDHDVEDPEEDEDGSGDGLDVLRAAQLAADGGAAAHEEDGDGDQSFDTEHRHGETQAEIVANKNANVFD